MLIKITFYVFNVLNARISRHNIASCTLFCINHILIQFFFKTTYNLIWTGGRSINELHLKNVFKRLMTVELTWSWDLVNSLFFFYPPISN
jgi:hypothetical protein